MSVRDEIKCADDHEQMRGINAQTITGNGVVAGQAMRNHNSVTITPPAGGTIQRQGLAGGKIQEF